MPKHQNILNLNQERGIVQLRKKKSMKPNVCVDDTAVQHRLHTLVWVYLFLNPKHISDGGVSPTCFLGQDLSNWMIFDRHRPQTIIQLLKSCGFSLRSFWSIP